MQGWHPGPLEVGDPCEGSSRSLPALAAPYYPARPSCMQSPVFLQRVTIHGVSGGSEMLLLPQYNLLPSPHQYRVE